MGRLCMQCRKIEVPVERVSWATPVCFSCVRPRPWEQTRSASCDDPEEDRKAWSEIMETLKDEGPAK